MTVRLFVPFILSRLCQPNKKSKLHPLSQEDKRENRAVAHTRVYNEHAIGFVKRFRILSERYRDRRKRFGLRVNLIAAICNLELTSLFRKRANTFDCTYISTSVAKTPLRYSQRFLYGSRKGSFTMLAKVPL
jgi:hypothetical protein